jgi:hypothetical protein
MLEWLLTIGLDFILTEDDDYILTEDGDKILLEGGLILASGRKKQNGLLLGVY